MQKYFRISDFERFQSHFNDFSKQLNEKFNLTKNDISEVHVQLSKELADMMGDTTKQIKKLVCSGFLHLGNKWTWRHSSCLTWTIQIIDN